jgi:hypothetical protein
MLQDRNAAGATKPLKYIFLWSRIVKTAVVPLPGRLDRDKSPPRDVIRRFEMGRPSRLELEADLEGGKIHTVRVSGCPVPVSRGIIQVPVDL